MLYFIIIYGRVGVLCCVYAMHGTFVLRIQQTDWCYDFSLGRIVEFDRIFENHLIYTIYAVT